MRGYAENGRRPHGAIFSSSITFSQHWRSRSLETRPMPAPQSQARLHWPCQAEKAHEQCHTNWSGHMYLTMTCKPHSHLPGGGDGGMRPNSPRNLRESRRSTSVRWPNPPRTPSIVASIESQYLSHAQNQAVGGHIRRWRECVTGIIVRGDGVLLPRESLRCLSIPLSAIALFATNRLHTITGHFA
eukprot:SAG11_NODE_6424_length_1317_cov_0.915435_1_plen_186_part_00